MFVKTVKYEDFLGNEREETLYFNLTQTEIIDFATELPSGVSEAIGDPNKVDQEAAAMKIVETIGSKGVIDFLKTLLLKSYGIPSEDGRKFDKSEEISKDFSQTMAYDTILMELMSDDKAASEFVSKIIPTKLLEKMDGKLALPAK